MSDDKPSPDQEPWRDQMVPAQSYTAAGSSLGPVPGSARLDDERSISVTITIPVSWLNVINITGEQAMRGNDLHWMKQLCAKIMIAAIPKPTGRRYESVDALMADNPPNNQAEPR